MRLQATAAQTIGPFFKLGLERTYCADLAGTDANGEPVEIRGHVFDGSGVPVPDALLEVWHADAEGRYPHPEDPRGAAVPPGFQGFGRIPTDADGGFHFRTVRPGRVPGPRGVLQAPHLVIHVFMRGLLRHACTRLYFPDDPAMADDPVLQLVPAERRKTLIARQAAPNVLEWDVHMQGEDETVFFEY